MSEIFISYKREDEARVARVVKELENAGLPVWWDRRLVGGENWRSRIENALNTAKCVIVIWTHESVGSAGDFVRDEAAQAKRRGVLVPVLLDMVDAPLGFGEIQAIDLINWKGRLGDPSFQDLLAAVTAKLEGRAVPPAKAPMKRLIRRLGYSGFATAFVLGGMVFRVQDHVCSMSLLQPHISDVCGGLGIGDRPTQRERIEWEGRESGSCVALRTHIERFPKGAYRAEASALLAARRVTQTEVWTRVTHRLDLFEPQADVPSANQVTARAAALAHAQVLAERKCRGYESTNLFRLRLATTSPKAWQCSPMANGVTCGFEGEAVCELDQRGVLEHETCGK